MRFQTLIVLTFLCSTLFFSCKQRQEARSPISHSSGSFIKKSIERNKIIVSNEEEKINLIIKTNPKTKYFSSKKGFWYTYLKKNEIDSLTPKKGDIAFFNYEIKNLEGEIIYSELQLRPQTYYVDKQDILIGLREGIKLMRKGEKVNFLFPSHKAYGYRGDAKKIGINTPLQISVTLKDFKSETDYKKEQEEKQKAREEALKNTLIDTISNTN